MGFFKKIGKIAGKIGKGVLRTAGGALKSVVGGATGGLSDNLLNAAKKASKKSAFSIGGGGSKKSISPKLGKVTFWDKLKSNLMVNWKYYVGGIGVLVLGFFGFKKFGGRGGVKY